MMENFNFTIYITRFVVVSKQLRVSSMLFTLEITEAGSALLVSHPHSSQLVLMLIIFIFISTFFCVSKNFKNTILFFSYILSKPKSVLFQSTTVFRGAPHGCANSKTSEERGHEQRTTHGRLEHWRIYMTTLHYYYTKTIDVGRKSFSHLMWVHKWISFTRISGFLSLFIWPSNQQLRHFLRENKIPLIYFLTEDRRSADFSRQINWIFIEVNLADDIRLSQERIPILLDRLSDLVSSSWHLCDANIVVAISQKKKKKKSSEKLPWNGSFFKPSISMAVVTLLHSTFLQV